ncbi:MAG: peptidoglycan DD-metalloendopeptidase family protein [Steroidobacteraceae bacterium]
MTWRCRWRSLLALLLAVTLCAAGARADTRDTEARLQALRERIAAVRKQLDADKAERNRLASDLREAEQAVQAVRGRLREIKDEERRLRARRDELQAERGDAQKRLDAGRERLATQMRAAYMIGRSDPLKLMFSGGESTDTNRMLRYFGYIGRARSADIDSIRAALAKLEELDRELHQEEEKLAMLADEQTQKLADLNDTREARASVLAKLDSQSSDRRQQLARLQREQAVLQRLLRELARASRDFPVDNKSPFGRLAGKLAWPVTGKLVARFGETRVGGLKWEGVLLATDRDTPIRAVHRGRIVYADWLAGLGLLVIVDHGGGYMSLYGYNDRIYKQVGEQVVAGDTIAAAGDSGGRSRPELYFEIRQGGKPVDPQRWFRTPSPPR